MSDTPDRTLNHSALSSATTGLRESGRLPFARWSPSPNFGSRPDASDISLLVVHCISLPPGDFSGDNIERFFQNSLDHTLHPYFRTIQGVTVSAHCLIRRDGEVIQFVNLKDRAWHAGRSIFCGREECNDYSVGIELEGAEDIPYTDEQYRQLSRVTREIMTAWPAITTDRIAGHSDVAPGRKTDPGDAFDWHYFRSLLAGTPEAEEDRS